jgi:hypothetical protein
MSETTNGARAARLDIDALDAVAIIGSGMITYGTHLIYAPAAWIVGGVFLVVPACITAIAAARAAEVKPVEPE